jgi:hypothetical protein
MIFSDLSPPAEAELITVFKDWLHESGKPEAHLRIKSQGMLFPDHDQTQKDPGICAGA